jgi:nucleoside 2-deoxyribosyltransferase
MIVLRRCFLALPRRSEFDNLRARLVAQLTSAEIETVDESSGRSVEETVQDADMMIADITGGDPNVMFEVGVAAGTRKPILPLAQHESQLPTALSWYRVIRYKPGDARLHTYVESWIQDAIASPRSLA